MTNIEICRQVFANWSSRPQDNEPLFHADAVLVDIVAGTHDAVMMVESEIQELTEEVVLGGVTFAHQGFQPVIDAIVELATIGADGPTGQFRDRHGVVAW